MSELERDLTNEAKILLNLTSVNTAVNDLQNKVEKHHKVLIEGNGEIPLVEKVRTAEAFINATKYWLKFVAGALILQTITFGAAAVIYFVKLYPLLEQLSKNP